MADWRERITVDPAILVGKPLVRGTRLAVEFVLELIAGGWTYDEILRNFPGLTEADVLACVACARESILEQRGPSGVR